MLDTWERLSIDEVIERVEARGRGRRGQAAAAVRDSPTPSGELLTIDLAVRDWARRDERSPSACGASTTGAWTTCARCSAPSAADEDDVEARCMLAFSLWIGNHFIAADHGPRSRTDVLEVAVRLLA